MKKIFISILAALALVAVVACTSPTPNLTVDTLRTSEDTLQTSNLVGSTWKWSSTNTTTNTETYHVNFGTDGTISATSSDGTTVPATDFTHTNFTVYRDGFYFEVDHDDDFDFFDDDDFEYYLDANGRLIVTEFVDDLVDLDDDYIPNFDDDHIPFTASGATNGIEGTWTFSADDRRGIHTDVTLVIGSSTLEVVAEKTLADGTQLPEMLATYTYRVDPDLDDDWDDLFDDDDDWDDLNEPEETTLKLTPVNVYEGYYRSFDDLLDDDDDLIRLVRDNHVITLEKI